MARGEFETIAALFKPLTRGNPAALGLRDDAARLRISARDELVVTADALVSGVHFLDRDPPGDIARKSLRTNLSDLAAKGAKPIGYFLSIARPRAWTDRRMTAFARGLSADGAEFGVPLLGGDSTSTPGPLTIAITALGTMRRGTMVLRSGARPGDDIWVSGSIGDGALGLLVATGKLRDIAVRHRAALLARYRVPEPKGRLGRALVGVAHAAMDISDGLVADLGHICTTSGVGANVEIDAVPFSVAAKLAIERHPELRKVAITGGDDYELLFAAPPSARAKVLKAARACGTSVARIGQFHAGASKVTVGDRQGGVLRLAHTGFTHF
ncbi:MAG: thiamine-phosphate kinase [Alphaproteobacteria bacterium]|nr:thiamine-phosphate kinase [Alphaproteobacteria bacterium]